MYSYFLLSHTWQLMPLNIPHGIIQVKPLRPRQNGRHFPDNIFKCIFLNENEWISIKISLKLVPKGQINNIPSLFQIMAWRRPGDKPLSEAMMVSLLTHICVTWPQWIKSMILITKNSSSGTGCEFALSWMLQNLINEKSTLVEVMVWCSQAASHYLNQYWPRFMSRYVTSLDHKIIWVRSWNCGCLVTWFCYHLIAKLDNKTAKVPWLDPYDLLNNHFAEQNHIQKHSLLRRE